MLRNLHSCDTLVPTMLTHTQHIHIRFYEQASLLIHAGKEHNQRLGCNTLTPVCFSPPRVNQQ